MEKPKLEQFGITKEQYDFINSKKEKILNYISAICSIICILVGSIFAFYTSHGLYEIILFILFFGLFIGNIVGAISGFILGRLFTLLLYIFSPVYRSSKHYIDAKSKKDDSN